MTNKKEVRTIDLDKEISLFEMFDYFCSRINFGKSALDAEAITCMNTLFIELRKDTRKVKV